MPPSQEDFSLCLVEWLLDHQLQSPDGVATVSSQFATLVSQAPQQSRENLHTHIARQIFRKATTKSLDPPVNLCTRLCYSLLLNNLRHGSDQTIRITRIHEHIFNLCIDSVRAVGSTNSFGTQEQTSHAIPSTETSASQDLHDTSLDRVSYLVAELYNLEFISTAHVYEYLYRLTESTAPVEDRLVGLCALFEARSSGGPDIEPWRKDMDYILRWAVDATSERRITEGTVTRIEAIVSTLEPHVNKSPGGKRNSSDLSSSPPKSSASDPLGQARMDVRSSHTLPISSLENNRSRPNEGTPSSASSTWGHVELDDRSLNENNYGKHPIENAREEESARRISSSLPSQPTGAVPRRVSTLPNSTTTDERSSPLPTSTASINRPITLPSLTPRFFSPMQNFQQLFQGSTVAGTAFSGPSSDRPTPVTQTASRNSAPVEEDQLVKRKVKALLKKLTMDGFDSISDQIIEWANKSKRAKDGSTLMQVTKLVFEKAKDEERSELYARLSRKMVERISPNVQDESVRDAQGLPISGGMLFRRHLLNKCQEDFERGWSIKEVEIAAAAARASRMAGDANDGTGLRLAITYAAAEAKRQGLGLVRFMCELFKLRLFSERIMHQCIQKLLSNVVNPKEEEIESVCKLFTTVGRILDNPKARIHMDIYFERMRNMVTRSTFDVRLRLTLLDVIELRARRWQARPAIPSPETSLNRV